MEIQGRIGSKTYTMSVDSQGRAQISASSESEDRHINKTSGKVWSADIDGILIDAGAYIAWFQNTSQEFYHLTDMRVHCVDAPSIVDIDHVTVGTIGNDTPFLPDAVTSRHIGNASTPVGNMSYAATASGLTGLTKQGNLFHGGSLDNKSSHLSTSSNIIIPPAGAVAIRVITANATSGIVATWSLVEISHST